MAKKKKSKRKSWKKAALDEFHEEIVSLMARIFEICAAEDPKVEVLRPEYDDAQAVMLELIRGGGEWNLPVIEERLPHNQWIKFFRQKLVQISQGTPLTPEEQAEGRREFRANVRKRLRGKRHKLN